MAESGEAGDETIRDIAGHVSRQMLKHYSHIGMEAKRRAVQSLVPKKPVPANGSETDAPQADVAQIPESSVKDSTKAAKVH